MQILKVSCGKGIDTCRGRSVHSGRALRLPRLAQIASCVTLRGQGECRKRCRISPTKSDPSRLRSGQITRSVAELTEWCRNSDCLLRS